ncbi:hypothetical protein BOC60_20215 [Burkholderia pseudomallei]|nr:hypothetical protein BOC60_20215 [Burkholderia pseudomallei]
MPEFRDAKVEDYEFRGDGKLVRKDRWECAIGSIRHMVGVTGREFEIPDVVEAVRKMAATFEGWLAVKEDSKDPDDWPEAGYALEVRLEDGSVLRNTTYERVAKRWLWNAGEPPLRVVAYREQRDPPTDSTQMD